jgi:hypothetical protein
METVFHTRLPCGITSVARRQGQDERAPATPPFTTLLAKAINSLHPQAAGPGLSPCGLSQQGINAHDVECRSCENMLEVGLGQADRASVSQPHDPHALGKGAFNTRANGIALPKRGGVLLLSTSQ